MALSDACFDFHMEVSAAASKLAEQAHEYSAPHHVIKYGPEIDALRRTAEYFAENPYDPEAGARLLRLSSTVLTYLDTHLVRPSWLKGKNSSSNWSMLWAVTSASKMHRRYLPSSTIS